MDLQFAKLEALKQRAMNKVNTMANRLMNIKPDAVDLIMNPMLTFHPQPMLHHEYATASCGSMDPSLLDFITAKIRRTDGFKPCTLPGPRHYKSGFTPCTPSEIKHGSEKETRVGLNCGT